jgi:hypothetical protein
MPNQELDEPVLPDDYPIHGSYLYVADGKIYRSNWFGITAHELKMREGFTEVRRCDMAGRDLLTEPESVVDETPKLHKKINRPSKRSRFQRKADKRNKEKDQIS